MRVLIQNTKTHLFLKANGKGTQILEEALSFRGTPEALRYVRENNFQDVQLILKLSNATDDVNVALLGLLINNEKRLARKSGKLDWEG